jgi:hypothetical protein
MATSTGNFQILVGDKVIYTVSVKRGEWHRREDGSWYRTEDKVTKKAGR